MEASLDTNVIIHLYKANLQSVLFYRFEKLKVYEFIRNHELINHAGQNIIDKFDKDVEDGKIEIVADQYFKSIGMYQVFLQYVKDLRILYDGGDLGEVYAIAMAKTLGCACLVTDDIKERGPHYTLMRIPDSEVIPFAFYEILFLAFLEGKMSEMDLLEAFRLVCTISGLAWDIRSKLKGFMKRFWKDPYSESEKEWMSRFCIDNGINAKARIQILWHYISN
jgi:hypothetical protein